jgi:SecD/SecF fusion protein
MKKKTSVVVLILIALLTVLLGYTAIVGWGPTGTGAIRNIKTGLDLSGGVSITYEAKEANPSQEDMNDTVYKLQQRVDNYSTEASVYQQGTNRISIEIPGVTDANTILEELGKPGSLEFTDSEGNVVLEGSDVTSAEGVTYQNQSGIRENIVQLQFTEEGKKKFAEATEANIGKQIYIVYDGEVISAPTVNEAITEGECQIQGMSSLEEAKNLASNIRIGSLSLELEEVYSNVVGATLGQEALSSSLIAGLIGIILVIVFMICVYRISGLASGWALIIFTFLDLIAINAYDVTLTLPGIAGVILTIGMAVDANVIVYARMREELAAGRSLFGSIKEGFRKAFSAILDGNVTTLIAAVVLYFLGTGTIRGFAITLGIGIILSMFSALVISRFISYALYGVGIKSEKAYGTIKQRKPINFVKRRAIFFTIAIILVASAPIGMGVFKAAEGKELNYSLDFVGGTATTVDFGEELSLEDLDNEVKPIVAEVTGDQNIQFQQISDTDQVVIKTRELNYEEREKLNTALAEKFTDIDTTQIQAENISSTISGEMRDSAFRAAIITIVCMLIYIWIRFRDIRFAAGAVIPLVHDLFVVLACYVFFRLPVGSSFIAVMLTILGYSINATIVVFDRIRENLKLMNQEPLRDIVNASITETLTRSIYSTFTTFITIFVLYLMGVPSIKEFSFPIIIGLIAGAYSSVCISGNLWYLFKTKIGKNRVADTEVSFKEATEPDKTEKLISSVIKKEAETKAAKNNVKNKKVNVDKAKYSSQPRGKKKR